MRGSRFGLAVGFAFVAFAGWQTHAATHPEPDMEPVTVTCPAEDSCQVDWRPGADGRFAWFIRTGGPDQGHVGPWVRVSDVSVAGE